MISSIVLQNWCQTEELCIVFPIFYFLAKYLASGIVTYETILDVSHTYSFVSYESILEF